MKSLKKMSKDERSLLLFLETRAVDYGGRVNAKHMNADDFKIAEQWTKEGFICFGRIKFKHINSLQVLEQAQNNNSDGANSVVLSKEAWKLAHAERKERFKRLWLKRTWITTKENIDMHGIAKVRFGQT